MHQLAFLFILIYCLTSNTLFAQSYTNYRTGNTNDTATTAQGGICLMGGATEDDNAMRWFLNRVRGGDVVVLRTSGSDGYNNYFYNSLGVTINSVETFVCHDSTAAYDAYLRQRLQEAEAVWFAGGDQWEYLQYWRNSPVDSLINLGIQQRQLVVGGTSAGMAIQGGYYFSAQNGTISSAAALNNPYDVNNTVDSSPFLAHDILQDVITDTHYDNPNRKGRHISFLARIYQDYGVLGKGIACDEYTAVCIDTNGIARVFGGAPTYSDIAYFIQPNCELVDPSPEQCQPNSPLLWNRNNRALKVYKIFGDPAGANSFDLNTWDAGTGGNWESWSTQNGAVVEGPDTAPICLVTAQQTPELLDWQIYPNPSSQSIQIAIPQTGQLQLVDIHGRILRTQSLLQLQTQWDISTLPKGYYVLIYTSEAQTYQQAFIKQ